MAAARQRRKYDDDGNLFGHLDRHGVEYLLELMQEVDLELKDVQVHVEEHGDVQEIYHSRFPEEQRVYLRVPEALSGCMYTARCTGHHGKFLLCVTVEAGPERDASSKLFRHAAASLSQDHAIRMSSFVEEAVEKLGPSTCVAAFKHASPGRGKSLDCCYILMFASHMTVVHVSHAEDATASAMEIEKCPCKHARSDSGKVLKHILQKKHPGLDENTVWQVLGRKHAEWEGHRRAFDTVADGQNLPAELVHMIWEKVHPITTRDVSSLFVGLCSRYARHKTRNRSRVGRSHDKMGLVAQMMVCQRCHKQMQC